MAITKLEQMFGLLKSKPKRRLSVAFANDPHTIEAVYSAVEKGIVILIGATTENPSFEVISPLLSILKPLNFPPSSSR